MKGRFSTLSLRTCLTLSLTFLALSSSTFFLLFSYVTLGATLLSAEHSAWSFGDAFYFWDVIELLTCSSHINVIFRLTPQVATSYSIQLEGCVIPRHSSSHSICNCTQPSIYRAGRPIIPKVLKIRIWVVPMVFLGSR